MRTLTQPADCARSPDDETAKVQLQGERKWRDAEGGRGEKSECDGWSWLMAVDTRREEAQTQTANQPQPQSDDGRSLHDGEIRRTITSNTTRGGREKRGASRDGVGNR